MKELFSVGEVATRSGLATSTLRYYDEIDLVAPTTRVGGQRRYAPAVLHRLRIIAGCRQAGFTLDEIRALLDGGGDWQQLARAKAAELDARIAELEDARALVQAALACDCARLESCDRLTHAQAARAQRRG